MGGSFGILAVRLGTAFSGRRLRRDRTGNGPGPVRTAAAWPFERLRSTTGEGGPSLPPSLIRLAGLLLASVALASIVLYLVGSAAGEAALDIGA